jgi:hypothetical protein
MMHIYFQQTVNVSSISVTVENTLELYLYTPLPYTGKINVKLSL